MQALCRPSLVKLWNQSIVEHLQQTMHLSLVQFVLLDATIIDSQQRDILLECPMPHSTSKKMRNSKHVLTSSRALFRQWLPKRDLNSKNIEHGWFKPRQKDDIVKMKEK